MFKFKKNPGLFLRHVVAEDESGSSVNDESGDDPQGSNDDAGEVQVGPRGFPENTRWRDMKPEHQTAYWRYQAQKHERDAKALREGQGDASKGASNDSDGDAEAAVRAAREAGRREGVGEFLHDAVRSGFQAQRPNMSLNDLDEFLDDLDLSKFLTDEGRLDTERITRMADKLDAGGSGDDTSGKGTLGGVLGGTVPPPSKSAPSVNDVREAERARYVSR